MRLEHYNNIELKASAFTFKGVSNTTAFIAHTDRSDLYRIISTGEVILFQNLDIIVTGTPQVGEVANFRYTAEFQHNGNTVTVLGKLIEGEFRNKQFDIRAVYNGASWDVVFLAGTTEPNIIAQTQLQDNSVGAAELIDGSVTLDKIDAGITVFQKVTGTLTPAQVNALNTTPVIAIPVVGGKTIVPVSATITAKSGTGTAAYQFQNSIMVIADGLTASSEASFLWQGLTKALPFPDHTNIMAEVSSTDEQLLLGTAIMLMSPSTDPQNGDYNIDYSITYYTI